MVSASNACFHEVMGEDKFQIDHHPVKLPWETLSSACIPVVASKSSGYCGTSSGRVCDRICDVPFEQTAMCNLDDHENASPWGDALERTWEPSPFSSKKLASGQTLSPIYGDSDSKKEVNVLDHLFVSSVTFTPDPPSKTDVGLNALLNMHCACSVSQSRDVGRLLVTDQSEGKPFEPLVQYLGSGPCTVDSEVVPSIAAGETEVLAIPPGIISVTLPYDAKPEQTVFLRGGPHCRLMKVESPKWAQPGMEMRLELQPPPEVAIQIPVGHKVGEKCKVRMADGKEVIVDIPAGMWPGDYLEFTPPSLMVAAPEDSNPGDLVVFRHHMPLLDGEKGFVFCRAGVPESLYFGRYFAARLPTSRVPLTRSHGSWQPRAIPL